ncbi:EG45-like domain containing protein [Tanacetum coccineum]
MPIYFNKKVILLGFLALLCLQPQILLHDLSSYREAGTGTSAHYGPPYLPTACHGNDAGQLPSNGLFAAAGNELWENGAACGRQYTVKCVGGSCKSGEVIQVKIVDYAMTLVSRQSHEGSTMVLSDTAFTTIIANSTPPDFIHIQFQRRCFINKEWILGIFDKSNWSFKLELIAEFESWMPEVKKMRLKHGNGSWYFHLKIKLGFLIFKVKVTLPPDF